jgi:hypothetical protein
MITRATQMSIAACPKGGFTVFTLAEEHQAFVENRRMIPMAAFSDLDPALAFIKAEMAPAADDRPVPPAHDD